MAEVAAGLWAAEEVVSTTAQVGVGAYMVSKPTMPLKATFSQIATSSKDNTKLSLSRSDHSLSIIGEKAYIFGGTTDADKLASNDVHVVNLSSEEKAAPNYAVIPAIPDVKDGKIPAARTKHAACAFNVCVAVFGGVDESGKLIDDGPGIWLFNTGKSSWEVLNPTNSGKAPIPRSNARLFDHNNNLVLYGGHGASGEALKDVWRYDYVENTWTQFPDCPVSTSAAALADGALYAIAGVDNMSSDMHSLQLGAAKEGEHAEWHTTSFSTNPLKPGPRPRTGAGLLHVSTGHGRNYLLYLFGADQLTPGTASSDEATKALAEDTGATSGASTAQLPHFWSDLWTYQTPSSSPEAKLTTSLSDAFKPAAIKDKIRTALGYDSGANSWAEVEVLPPAELEASEGKVHPGPRGFFGCDVMPGMKSVVLWGGVSAKGEKEGDGWLIRLE